MQTPSTEVMEFHQLGSGFYYRGEHVRIRL